MLNEKRLWKTKRQKGPSLGGGGGEYSLLEGPTWGWGGGGGLVARIEQQFDLTGRIIK